jgi:hypothetical protein
MAPLHRNARPQFKARMLKCNYCPRMFHTPGGRSCHENISHSFRYELDSRTTPPHTPQQQRSPDFRLYHSPAGLDPGLGEFGGDMDDMFVEDDASIPPNSPSPSPRRAAGQSPRPSPPQSPQDHSTSGRSRVFFHPKLTGMLSFQSSRHSVNPKNRTTL